MKAQVHVMVVASVSGEIDRKPMDGELFTTGKVKIKRERSTSDSGESDTGISREALRTRHSHHRKKLMEKWMKVQENGSAGEHRSPPRGQNTDDAERISKSPASPRNNDNDVDRSVKSPSSPPPVLTDVPADPRKWTAQHVAVWLDVLSTKYSMMVDRSYFQMNGRALCLMSRDGFLRRVPEKGAILYEDFRGRVRRYFTACRRRVRTTFVAPGMSQTSHVAQFHAPSAPQMPGVPLMSGMRPGIPSPWIEPFSALRNKPSEPTTSALPTSDPSGLRSVPTGHSTTTNLHPAYCPPRMSVPPSNASGHSSLLVSAPAAISQTSAVHTATSLGMNSSVACSVASAAEPKQLRPAPPSINELGTNPITESQAISTKVNTPPSTSAFVSSTCPVHGASTAAGAHAAPYSYHGVLPYVHAPPYYHFVPLYRNIRVVGQFQPLIYGFPGAGAPTMPSGHIMPPVSLQPVDHSHAAGIAVSSTADSQPRAVDLSMSSTSTQPSLDVAGSMLAPEAGRKKVKSEPSSP